MPSTFDGAEGQGQCFPVERDEDLDIRGLVWKPSNLEVRMQVGCVEVGLLLLVRSQPASISLHVHLFIDFVHSIHA